MGFVYGHPLHFREGVPLPAARTRVARLVYLAWALVDRAALPGRVNCITSPEVMVRTSVQKQVGGYDPRLPHTGDLEMWMRLAAHARCRLPARSRPGVLPLHGQNMTEAARSLVDL